MEWNLINSLIAALALLLSGLSLWFQRRDKMYRLLVKLWIPHLLRSDPERAKDLQITATVVNSGNRSIQIRRCYLFLLPEEELFSMIGAGFSVSLESQGDSSFPFVLEAGRQGRIEYSAMRIAAHMVVERGCTGDIGIRAVCYDSLDNEYRSELGTLHLDPWIEVVKPVA